MKKQRMLVWVIGALVLAGCQSNVKTSSSNESQTNESSVTTSETVVSTSELKVEDAAETKAIDIAGKVYASSGDIATISNVSANKWCIQYSTSDGTAEASFATDWQETQVGFTSETAMEKADGYSSFTITIQYVSASDMTIKMSDGVISHEMTFTKQKPAGNATYDVVLQGDLTPFEGTFSTDSFNQSIADSGFTLGGYDPEDYYQNRTTVFPAITKNGYWNGIASHGEFAIDSSDLPKKVNQYYEMHLYGTNPGANNATLTFYLVPPKVKGPDGITSDDRRVFFVVHSGKSTLLKY